MLHMILAALEFIDGLGTQQFWNMYVEFEKFIFQVQPPSN